MSQGSPPKGLRHERAAQHDSDLAASARRRALLAPRLGAMPPVMQHVATPPAEGEGRLVRIVLEGEALTRLSPILEADRAQAVADLQMENRFAPAGVPPGDYALRLSIQQGRLAFDIRRLDDTPLIAIVLALGPFRGIIKDYQMLVDSHILAVQEGREERIQAIDMGRRGLHNEGAELMMQRLRGKVAIDFATARRLFTLICVLHQRI